MVTMPDEAQPRRRGGRRAICPKRVELRMTQSSFDLAEESAKRASEATGRAVTVSDIIREAVEDGCRRLAREQAQASTRRGGADPDVVDGLIDDVLELRTEMRKVGHNVNQMAKVAHQTGQVTGDLDDVKRQLEAIDGRLVELAGRIAGVDD